MTDAQLMADQAARSKAMASLISNAGEIAKFLAGANPNLPEDAVAACWSRTVLTMRRRSSRSWAATPWRSGHLEAMQAHMDRSPMRSPVRSPSSSRQGQLT